MESCVKYNIIRCKCSVQTTSQQTVLILNFSPSGTTAHTVFLPQVAVSIVTALITKAYRNTLFSMCQSLNAKTSTNERTPK